MFFLSSVPRINSMAVRLSPSFSAQHSVSPFPIEISNLLTLLSSRFSQKALNYPLVVPGALAFATCSHVACSKSQQ